jgi:hypothetical protein
MPYFSAHLIMPGAGFEGIENILPGDHGNYIPFPVFLKKG